MQGGHRFVADDGGTTLHKASRCDELASFCECSGFDDNIVGALGEIDMDGGHTGEHEKSGGHVHPRSSRIVSLFRFKLENASLSDSVFPA